MHWLKSWGLNQCRGSWPLRTCEFVPIIFLSQGITKRWKDSLQHLRQSLLLFVGFFLFISSVFAKKTEPAPVLKVDANQTISIRHL